MSVKSKALKPSKLEEVVYKSYQDVINKKLKAGKNVSNLTTRLNLLMSKYKTQLKIECNNWVRFIPFILTQ